MTNIINRLQLDLQFSQQEEAFNTRHNFAQTFQVQIEEVVERVCAKYVTEDEWLKINRLEINLGRFRPNAFRHQFSDVFLYHFEKALTEKLLPVTSHEREESRRISQLEVFEYFLKNGVLPWFANEEDTDIDKISLEIANGKAGVLKSILFKNRFQSHVWKRISFQLSDEVKSLIFDLFEELKEAEQKAINLLDQIFTNNSNSIDADRQINHRNTRNALLEEAADIFQIPQNLSMIREAIVKHASLIFVGNQAAAASFCKDENMAEIEGSAVAFKDNAKDAINTIKTGEYLLKNIFKERDEEQRFVVKHAGILLLSPFFHSFFTRLQLMNGIEWISKQAQYKAVHLLKFLSTGRLQSPEYMLTLEKIFCGLAADEPVPAQVELTEDDLREAGDLLESVIEHWKVLKNTSANGLREAFLKRDGIITRTDDGWLIRVERKTHDVLLDSIPWGYSTISLAWNRDVIFVEW